MKSRQYADHAWFVTNLGAPVIDLLAPRPGERILDLGCGDADLTKQLTDADCDGLGVDGSPAMVEATQARGVAAQVMDGHELPFHEQFDAVFSNAALPKLAGTNIPYQCSSSPCVDGRG